MHIRDRLRATLARRRTSQICWSCALLPAQQSRSLQAATTAKSFNHDDHAVEAQRTPALTPRKQERLPGICTSLANGRIRQVLSCRIRRTLRGTDRPRIIRLQQDGRTGAQVWPSSRVHRVVRENPEENTDTTTPSRSVNVKTILMPPVPLLKARAIRKHTRTDQSKNKIRSWARRKMRSSQPLLRKIRSKKPGSIALASSDDNLPVWIGRSRQRRYVIQDSVGKKIHILYTTPARQTMSSESKEHKHYSNRLAEPDHHLVEETEELLKLWAKTSGRIPTTRATLPPKLSDPAQRLPVSIPDSLTSEPASDTSPFTDNAVLFGSNLPYVPEPGGVASSFHKASPHDSHRFGHWPVTKSVLNSMSVGHSLRPPPTVKARGLHTATVRISLPPLS